MSAPRRAGSRPAPSAPEPTPFETGATSAQPSAQPGGTGEAAAADLVAQLIVVFRDQVRRSLGVELDGSETSLAFVDHYLTQAREEDREPIVSLLASGAGAYFGDVVRTLLGATWIGDGKDPRRLRLLMRYQLLHFSPVDQAYEAIAGASLDPEDPRLPDRGAPFDPAFHLGAQLAPRPDSSELPADDDAEWLGDRLSELLPVAEDQFYSLTCRFETLKLMLELLAAKHESEGKRPREHGLKDYLAALDPSA